MSHRVRLGAQRLAVAVWCVSIAGPERAASQAPNPDAQALPEFSKRIAAYADLRDRLARELPGLTGEADPHAIEAYQRALAGRVQEARRAARQGDLLTTDVQPILRRLIRETLAQSEPARAAIAEENPGPIQLQVNARYAENLPKSRMPAALLANLPRLPDGLEFRFAGRQLILYDTEAGLILDFMARAF